ncbi:MAG: hypothetical protein J6C93_00780 [Clostridia bacterium]|nr:hypothetical protein [Clostridia bacterium]
MQKRKRQKYVYDSNAKKETIAVTIPEEIYQIIQSEAEDKSETASKIVAEILEKYYSSK